MGDAPEETVSASASTCINTSSPLRSRLVAAILDSRDGLSITSCVRVAACVCPDISIYRDRLSLSSAYNKQQVRGLNVQQRVTVKSRERNERENKRKRREKVACSPRLGEKPSASLPTV